MQDHLTLDEFVFEMMRIPSADLTMVQLFDLANRLDLADALVHSHIFYDPETYARNLLCRTPRFDLLVLCWRPGQVTTIHDHATSLNVTRVYQGTLTTRSYEVIDRPEPGHCQIRQSSEEHLQVGGLATVDFAEIHQLANTSSENLVTVHVYARPLKDINVYDLETHEVRQVALRYTLEDEFA